MGVRLNQEKGYTRFRYICEFLADAGYEVDLITTTFQHWEKEQRDLEKIKADDYKFGLKFIYEPGYKKNIDLQRIRSHRIAAKNLTALLEKEGDYDLLYAEIPPNDVALAAARYAEKKGIPFVVDVNDLWPEASADGAGYSGRQFRAVLSASAGRGESVRSDIRCDRNVG